MGKSPINTDVQFWRDPDLPGVEVRYSSYNEDAFCKHTHPAYSIGFIETGRTTFALEGAEHKAEAGQMVFIEPEVVHVCNPDLDSDMTYYMFYIDASWLESVAKEVFGNGVGGVHFPVPVVDDPDLLAHWRTLHQAIAEGDGKLEKESLLVQGLADCLTRHAELGEPEAPGANDMAVMAVTVHLSARITDKVSLDELSEVAGLSRYHLLRVFQASTGLPPHAFQTQLRVDLGKRMLASGRTISQAAVEAGFADQSHFSRVFKKITGATPKQYQDAAE
ncbi:AraC family transcriptional regulator [Pseudodesulfovibrio sediminis]|uniref:AraC family transcriptional regulator n=1 Tax=Pseudodesulfovibrio sediminis TaxID=2810563 RepID=A0ABN6EW02_9BACT|nr:AraC family transcriptional regulator [Pseudodesulfovibrio sediminis]BCS89380.1 AraC family transcriptional regulator [Pseudodesulfovibrio sediminis]